MKNEADQAVFLALASYTGKPDLMTLHSILELHKELSLLGIPITFQSYAGDGRIHAVRNVMVAEFRKSSCTDLIMVDDDVGWQQGTAELLLHPKADIVGAIYRLKQDEEDYLVRQDEKKPVLISDPLLGYQYLEVEAVATGFLRISRRAIETMCKAYPETQYVDDPRSKEPNYRLFSFELEGNRDWGEDFVFCRRAVKAGLKVHCVPDVMMSHVGRKVWMGAYGNWLRKRPGNAEVIAETRAELESVA